MEEMVDTVSGGGIGPHLEDSFKLIILACKYNQTEVLKSLLSGQSERVGTTRDWNYTDDEGHNAVYYAIRSSNVDLLDALLTPLISLESTELLDQLLSGSLDELVLKNVLIQEEMQLFIQSKLIKLRFYSKDNELHTSSDKALIQQRLQLIIKTISTLTTEYSHRKVDSRFIYIAKFIAQNIHISKQVLKSTYSAVPWEEIEFCLVCFISAHTELKQINLFYLSVLRKGALLKRLSDFSQALCDLEGFILSSDVSKLRSRVRFSREKVIAGIISKYPKFQGLYTDYKVIRDIYSLDTMKSYIDSALPVDPATREGQLTIKRTLQVLGEHLKDTLDSPNLSTAISDLLLFLAPRATRDILKDLRNSISHAHFIQDNDNTIEVSKLYLNILNDIKKIATVISDINYSNKINVLTQLLSEEFMNIDLFEGIMCNLNHFLTCSISQSYQNLNTKEHQNIGDVVEAISRLVSDKTPFEEKTLTEIMDLDKSKIKNSNNLQQDFLKLINHLLLLDNIFQRTTCNRRKTKYWNWWRKHCFPQNVKNHPAEDNKLEVLKTLSNSFYESVSLRILPEFAKEIHYLLLQIQVLFSNKKNTINWIDEYRTQLCLHAHHDRDIIQRKNLAQTDNVPKDDVLHKSITLYLCELGDIIGTNRSHHTSRNLLPLVQQTNHNKLRIEALMLDTMSLLEQRTKCLSNNWLYLDDDMPLLSGRALRNYLAHGNPLVDNILSSDPFSAMILNTMILTEPNTVEILILNNGTIGKISTPNIKKLEQKFEQNLEIINKQEEMFKVLVEGNLKGLKTCLREGVDLYSRSLINCSTTLHAAAKGTSAEMVKMLIENNISPDSRNINGQTPLHIAAACGRDAIVRYLVEEVSVLIDQRDTTGKTPLHMAALNGHKETVVTLLSLGADVSNEDGHGFSSIYYALANNHIETVKVLLEVHTAATVDDNDLTPLHIAAEYGHAELVLYLLQENRADVNAKSLQGARPLHFAAANGHQDIVLTLIKHGAYVNLQTTNGFTPLHCAILSDHENVMNILLKEGAFVDIVCKKTGNTPLHTAITNGHKRIVQIVLENHPNVNILNNDGLTPLLCAARSGNCNVVELLLEAGAQLDYQDKDGFSALHICAVSGHNDMVTLLLERGFVIDARTAKQLTPLHLAAGGGHQKTVDILLAAGANVCCVCDYGNTPLHLSAGAGHVAVSESLILKGSNVNTKNKMNFAPLHLAAQKACNEKTVQLLLKCGANVEEVCADSNTALHMASFQGHSSVVKALIEGQANVRAVNVRGDSALHLAVTGNHKAIVILLLDNSADVNFVNDKHDTALCSVAHNNSKEILDILLAKGANVNAGGGRPLTAAVSAGHTYIVKALLKHKDLDIHINVEDFSFLQSAAVSGYWHIGRALINKGVKIDSIGPGNLTALLLAVKGGHKEFVDVLLEHAADANLTPEGLPSPLHLAATLDHPGVVESLLRSGAKHDALDKKNHTPIELTIIFNQLNNMNCFFKHCNIQINAKRSNDRSLLKLAANEGNVKVVKYLLDRGAHLHTRDSAGIKAIHIAAYQGHVKLVEFFLECGMSIGDLGESGATLLHLASLAGHPTLVQYLIDKHADINAIDLAGKQPIHYAAGKGHKDLVVALLSNGAMYDAMDGDGNTPLELTSDADIRELLVSVGQLFEVVKENAVSNAEKLIKEIGKAIDAKSADNSSLLHLATGKGFQELCNIFLKKGANPNAAGKDGKTPLHLASEFSHLGIVVSLLQSGAVYNIYSEYGKTPFDLATQENDILLLKLVQDSFEKAEKCDTTVIEDINKIGDIEIIKAVLRSRNTQGRTLVEVAIKNNFLEVDRLYEILQYQFSHNLTEVKELVELKNFTKALSILKEMLNEREHLLGRADPGNLVIQQEIALIFYSQSKVFNALSIFEEIYGKRRDTLGPNHRLSLRTRSQIASVLSRLGRNQEALHVFQEVIAKQKDALGEDHMDLLQVKIHAAQCLYELKKFNEALKMNREVLENLQKIGLTDTLTLIVQTNITSVLREQGKLEEASSISRQVYEKTKSIYGINNFRTLRIQGEVAQVLHTQGKTAEALEVYREVYAIQKNVLGSSHIDTLVTCTNIVDIYLSQGKLFEAQRVYRKGLKHRDPQQIDDSNMLALDSFFEQFTKYATNGFHTEFNIYSLQSRCEMDIIVAASTGDITLVESLIRCGSDVNTADTDGRTPLHFAANRGHADIVKLLLKSGADATTISVRGNTALHTAASRGCVDSVGALLQTVKTVKARAYNDFINAKTVVGGASALHVAAKKGFLDIVKCLLEHGAIYNSPSRSNGYTALQCSGSQAITSILELAQEMFDCAEKGEIPQISAEKQECLLVVLSSRDMQGRTPVQVARFHHHHSVVAFLEGAQQTKINIK